MRDTYDVALRKFTSVCTACGLKVTSQRFEKYLECFDTFDLDKVYYFVIHVYFGGVNKSYVSPFIAPNVEYRRDTTKQLGSAQDLKGVFSKHKKRRYTVYLTWNTQDHAKYSKGWVIHNA